VLLVLRVQVRDVAPGVGERRLVHAGAQIGQRVRRMTTSPVEYSVSVLENLVATVEDRNLTADNRPVSGMSVQISVFTGLRLK